MSKHAKKIDQSELAEQVVRIIDNLKTGVNPEEVVCMMGIVVSQSPDNPITEDGKPMAQLHHFVLGDPEDIRKMMLFMIEHSFEAPDDEEDDNEDVERVH